MSKIERIIMFEGGVETLDYFSRQMGQAFEAHGLLVFYFNLEDAASDVKKVKKFILSGKTAIVTFNFEGFEREEYIYDNVRGYIWQHFDIEIYNIAVDHPYFYDNRFEHLLEDDKILPGLIKKYHHLSIDREHQKYMRTFYPQFDEAGFLPLAGTRLDGKSADTVICDKIAKETKAKDKSRDIIFTGNYTDLAFFDQYIYGINDEYAQFYMGMIDDLIANPDKTVENVIISHCNEEMGPQRLSDLRVPIHKTIFVDMFVRSYFRGKMIQTLANAGFEIAVVGAGWETLPLKKPNRFTIIPQTNSRRCLELIKDSRISVNIMPWFKNGVHDRVFNSIINDTVCFTDGSGYLNEVLSDGEGLRYYDLNDLSAKSDGSHIVDSMEKLLSDYDKLDSMAETGKKIVSADHTWKNRAKKLMELFML